MKYLYILLALTLFSCKKEVEETYDTILIKVNSTTPVSGRLMGINDDIQMRYPIFPITGLLNTTTQIVTKHYKTYEIALESTQKFTVDITISGIHGVKQYHYTPKYLNFAAQFTS